MTPRLWDLVLEHDELALFDPAERRLALRELVLEAGVADVAGAIEELEDALEGPGPLSRLMEDPDVTDVMVNGPGEVWVERSGRLERTAVRFADVSALTDLIERLTGPAGARVDASHPIADARLSDGSRLHVVLPPAAPGGPLVSIRRFPRRRFGLDDLVELGMCESATAAGLRAAVAARRNLVVAGATGTGKTTLLDALLGEVSADERVVVVEETPELAAPCPHAVSLVARGVNIEGRGDIGLDELARAALRMRPDRLVIGEVRGPEMLTALDAMSTGHDGSLLTVHARSATGALSRMASLACRGSPRIEHTWALAEITSVVDLVVHLDRCDGRRRIAEVLEVGPA